MNASYSSSLFLSVLGGLSEFMQIPGSGMLIGFAVACFALGYMQSRFCAACRGFNESRNGD